MLSRRNFINTTLAAGAALATQGSTMAQSKRMIVDAQAHLWKAESEDWKWVPGMKPQMADAVQPMVNSGLFDRFEPLDVRALMRAHFDNLFGRLS